MQKPTRTQLKNTAITVGVLGTALATATYGNHLVQIYYQTKIDNSEMLMVLNKIAAKHPDVLKEALEEVVVEIKTALAPIS